MTTDSQLTSVVTVGTYITFKQKLLFSHIQNARTKINNYPYTTILRQNDRLKTTKKVHFKRKTDYATEQLYSINNKITLKETQLCYKTD